MEKRIAIITSTNIQFHQKLILGDSKDIVNKYANVEYKQGTIGDVQVFVFNRSSKGNLSAPHEVSYRGYMTAINQLGIKAIYATSIVGSLNPKIENGNLVILDQFLDFTKKRDVTIFDEGFYKFTDFTYPYCNRLRDNLIDSVKASGEAYSSKGCYVGVDGPRYETAAEVKMFSLLGGDVVGMSNVPEVVFAREFGICYSSIAFVSNLAAGLSQLPITIEDINYQTNRFQEKIVNILFDAIKLNTFVGCSCCVDSKILPRFKA